MQKVLVIGSPGSGKTEFAINLAARIKLPLIHLDSIYHLPKWPNDIDRKRPLWRQEVKDILKASSWIIDGNYGSTLQERFSCADTVFFLDYPRHIAMYRAIKRRIKFHKKVRPDMPDGWQETLSIQFLSKIWHYKDHFNATITDLSQAYPQTRLIVFKVPRDAKTYLSTLEL